MNRHAMLRARGRRTDAGESMSALRRKPAQAEAHANLPTALAGAAHRSGFVLFFEREWPRLRRYLTGAVGAQEAEDLAQEAFARLYAVSGPVRSVSGLLYQTARNLVIDKRRRAARTRAFLVEDALIDAIADPHPSPEDQADWRSRLERTSAMLDRMSARCRQVFELRVSEECTYAEIAERLNISVVAVEKQLLRAFEICAACDEDKSGPKRRRGRTH